MREIPKDSVPVGFLRVIVMPPGRPVEMPRVEHGHLLICEFIRIPNMPDYTYWYICDSLEDILAVYDLYMAGQAFSLGWWSAPGGDEV